LYRDKGNWTFSSHRPRQGEDKPRPYYAYEAAGQACPRPVGAVDARGGGVDARGGGVDAHEWRCCLLIDEPASPVGQ
jgi:hypothetical protein